ncbi:hypothetical protein FOL46_004926 [Perkinsus olseni]|uniref:Uncharacterized protein n=2 Tax=Perkinsus olseni TaxID=32597 RepID=A0A7J6MXJ7_PEROL|nr:hypothetical protein FOL46_004926 [Perkinsus olseni]
MRTSSALGWIPNPRRVFPGTIRMINAKCREIAFTPKFGGDLCEDDEDPAELDEITKEYMLARRYNSKLAKENEVLQRRLEEVRHMKPKSQVNADAVYWDSSARVKMLEDQLSSARELERIRLEQFAQVLKAVAQLKPSVNEQDWSRATAGRCT